MEQNKIQNDQGVQLATIYKIASGIVIAALLIVGSVVFATSFEPSSRYFLPSPITFALYAAIGISVAFTLSAFFILKGLSVSPTGVVTSKMTAALSAAASAVPFIYYIYSDVSERIALLLAAPSSPADSRNGLDILSVMITVTAAISLICFLYLTIRGGKISYLLAEYTRVIFLALIITKLYLDFSVELNSPVKILLQFAAAAALIATVAKLRPVIGKSQATAFASAQFLSAALCLLCFAMFAFEIAPHSAKYTSDLMVFPIMLLIFGVESIVLLFTCRIASPNEPAEVSETGSEESATEESADEAHGDADEATEDEASSNYADTDDQ